MVPSSVEKSKVAGALRPLTVMTKPEVVLLTTPLGVEVVPVGNVLEAMQRALLPAKG